MKTPIIITTIVAAAVVLAAATAPIATAQEKPKDAPKKVEGEKKKSDVYPFNGKVASVDKTARTVTLQGKEKTRVIQITGDTRIMKLGKPATLDDATVGESVGGQVRRTADGKEAAVSLRIGPAPEGKAKDGEKKKEEKK